MKGHGYSRPMLAARVAQRRQTLRRKSRHLLGHYHLDAQVLAQAKSTQRLVRSQPQLVAQGFRFSLCFRGETVGKFGLSNHWDAILLVPEGLLAYLPISKLNHLD